ncbi:hypothetical protein HQ865_18805 [Mucilaginibacter mali]|uniref:Uncharacterized protein n=1 Tax=Mucilaginibacter mali TaxID=2740462 RepID=A0A7D4QME6_9SPHI|nr:hypothetical protein [Mucilaginibacter mali]QKJ31730.1 hypothetical protein HQ865_18805 [Mucilaginibacter mali]
MDKIRQILGSPAAVYGWSIGFFVAVFFALPFLKYVIDEALVIKLSLLSVKYFTALLLVVSLLTSIVFFDWFSRYWYINLLVFAVAALVLVRLYMLPYNIYY